MRRFGVFAFCFCFEQGNWTEKHGKTKHGKKPPGFSGCFQVKPVIPTVFWLDAFVVFLPWSFVPSHPVTSS